MDLSQLVGGEGPQLPVQLVKELELHALQHLSGFGVHLLDKEIGVRLVAVFQGVQPVPLDLHIPGRAVQAVAGEGLGFLHHDPGTGGEVGDKDKPCVIRNIGSDGPAVQLAELEGNAGHRFAGHIVYLLDLQPHQRLVRKLEDGGFVGDKLHCLGGPLLMIPSIMP